MEVGYENWRIRGTSICGSRGNIWTQFVCFSCWLQCLSSMKTCRFNNNKKYKYKEYIEHVVRACVP